METIINNLKNEVNTYQNQPGVGRRQPTQLKSADNFSVEDKNTKSNPQTNRTEWEEEEIEMSLDKADKLIQEFDQRKDQQ